MDISHNIQFRWNHHISHLSQTFSELRSDEVYCDTTLVTEDGFLFKVHGAVLITTSRYFEKVLSNVTADQHPTVVLNGIKFAELSCLLDYIYKGVTQIDQHLMKSVLEVADVLDIKGLSNMKNNSSIKKLIAPSPSAVLSRSSPLCSIPSKSPSPSPHTHSSPCHSPSYDAYTQAVALKLDTEDVDEELNYTSAKSRHTFLDKAVGGEKSIEGVATSKNIIFSSNSDYSEPSVGIDLSLSRVPCEETDKIMGKNFSHEDAPLRKRKIMNPLEDTTSTSELECSKYEDEKSEDLMPHKKKRSFSRSVINCDVLHETQEGIKLEEANNKNSTWRVNLWQGNNDQVHGSKFQPKFINVSGLISNQEVSDSLHENEEETCHPRSATVPHFSKKRNQDEFDFFTHSTQNALKQDPLYIPEINESSSSSACSSEVKKYMRSVDVDMDVCDVTNFVAVNVIKGNKFEDKNNVVDHQTKEVFREIDQRIQRPISKVKRPLSKFNLFVKEVYPTIAEQHPEKKGQEILRIISSKWNSLPSEQKEKWEKKANDLLIEFKIRNPDYVFCPQKFQEEKSEYNRKKLERRNMFKINPFISKF